MRYKLYYIGFVLAGWFAKFPLRVTTRKRIQAKSDSAFLEAYRIGDIHGQIKAVGPDGYFDSIRNHYVTGTGQLLKPVHTKSAECDEYGCVVHNPSEHSLRRGRTHWRGDRGLMERILGTAGHLDPDDYSYKLRTFGSEKANNDSVHGCAGECDGAYARRLRRRKK